MRVARILPFPLVLGLAVAASLLELGPLVVLLENKKGIIELLIAGLAYQVGNAAPRPAAVSGRYTVTVVAIGAAALLMFLPLGTAAWFVAIALLSWALQVTRRKVTAGVTAGLPTTAQKRTARVFGFIAATMASPVWIGGTLFAICVGVLDMKAVNVTTPPGRRGFGHPLEWIMVVHQTHYFCYAYAVPLLVALPELGGLPVVGFWFACGWVSYLSAEALWRRWPTRRVFIIGHLSLAAALMLMSMTATSPWMALAFWIMSGFGGGTVYCLTLLHKHEGLTHDRLERAEDIGHLLGVAVAIAGVLFLDWSASALPAAGSIWALTAAFAMLGILALTARHSSCTQSTETTGVINADK